MTDAEAEASIQNSLRRIFESQKSKLDILYKVDGAEPAGPEYEEAVKDMAETLGIKHTGGSKAAHGRSRRSNRKTLKRITRRFFTKRR